MHLWSELHDFRFGPERPHLADLTQGLKARSHFSNVHLHPSHHPKPEQGSRGHWSAEDQGRQGFSPPTSLPSPSCKANGSLSAVLPEGGKNESTGDITGNGKRSWHCHLTAMRPWGHCSMTLGHGFLTSRNSNPTYLQLPKA